jgi:plasmid stabilization system protein ParE
VPFLIWSPPALLDVQRLYRFLASNNTPAAKRAVKAIREGVKIVAKQPGIGRPAEHMEPEYREWLIDFGDSGYVVLYRYDAQTEISVILAVRHQREISY